jgi:hypothetical protein
LPVAVLTAIGPASVWRFPAYLVAAVGGLLWAFYSRRLELLVIPPRAPLQAGQLT